MTYTIYLITIGTPGPKAAYYIGQTSLSLATRLSAHKSATLIHKSFWGDRLGEAMAKGETINIHPLAFASSETEARDLEAKYVRRYLADGADLFNRITTDKEGRTKFSLDARRRQSQAHKGISTVKQPVFCPETGVLFPSMSAAARAYGQSVSSICNSIRHGCRNHGLTFMRVGA